MNKFNARALGYTGAIVSAAGMLFLGVFGGMGVYTGASSMMQEMHMFYSPSFGGIIGGMVEAAIVGFVFSYAFGWVYNKFS